MAEPNSRQAYLQQLIQRLSKHLSTEPGLQSEGETENLKEALEQFAEKSELDSEDYHRARLMIEKIILHYPMLMDRVERDILWLLGGELLHYLGDEEINLFQRLDERCYELEEQGDKVDWPALKKQLGQLH